MEIKYLESKKFDFSQPPENEEKRKEFITFLLDDRRLINTSLKLLRKNGLIDENVFKNILEVLANLYFEPVTDPSGIKIDEENTEPEYLESIKKKKDDISLNNSLLEKIKKKIKFNFVKAEVIKKKENNIGGFIVVRSNMAMVESMTEIENVEVANTENEAKIDSELKTDDILKIENENKTNLGEKSNEEFGKEENVEKSNITNEKGESNEIKQENEINNPENKIENTTPKSILIY